MNIKFHRRESPAFIRSIAVKGTREFRLRIFKRRMQHPVPEFSLGSPARPATAESKAIQLTLLPVPRQLETAFRNVSAPVSALDLPFRPDFHLRRRFFVPGQWPARKHEMFVASRLIGLVPAHEYLRTVEMRRHPVDDPLRIWRSRSAPRAIRGHPHAAVFRKERQFRRRPERLTPKVECQPGRQHVVALRRIAV